MPNLNALPESTGLAKNQKETVRPYKGTDEYIFISYSHKDKKDVFYIISLMIQHGFRLWFDEGIDPGTEWDENIARHIEKSSYFISFISENYIESSNCKDELNYARDKEKPRLLIYLRDVILPSGMAMRLNRIQAIHYYKYSTIESFFKKFCDTEGISSFRTQKITFDQIPPDVVDRKALESCRRFIEKDPSNSFLFLVGQDYTARSYLMRAISDAFLDRKQDAIVLQMDEFTDRVCNALREGISWTEFRRPYERVDFLVLEEFHFISGKETTQEEIFMLLKNRFYNRKATLITCPNLLENYAFSDEIVALTNEWKEVSIRASQEQKIYCPTVTQEHPVLMCQITIFSPVSVDVYLNDKANLIMRLDCNSGFDYEQQIIPVPKNFNLIFVSKGFEKSIPLSVPCNKRIEYRLKPILTQAEIVASYDRLAALCQLEIEPTSYAFEQLASVGLPDDITILQDTILTLSSETSPDDSHSNYLIACCAVALGKLAIKYKEYEKARILIDIYDIYPAKESYGYMFDNIMKKLLAGLNNYSAPQKNDSQDKRHDPIANNSLSEQSKNNKSADFPNDERNHHADTSGSDIFMDEDDEFFYMMAVKFEKEKNELDAIRDYESAADLGSIKAQVALGVHYFMGDFEAVGINYEASKKLFEKAAQQGDKYAQYNLGVCYETGTGVDENLEEAFNWYQKSANQGLPVAQKKLAECYYCWSNIPENYTQTVILLTSAIKNDDNNDRMDIPSFIVDPTKTSNIKRKQHFFISLGYGPSPGTGHGDYTNFDLLSDASLADKIISNCLTEIYHDCEKTEDWAYLRELADKEGNVSLQYHIAELYLSISKYNRGFLISEKETSCLINADHYLQLAAEQGYSRATETYKQLLCDKRAAKILKKWGLI